MNVVIREIVETLWWNYDVKDIFGAKFGYGGIYKYPLIKLDHDFVKFIHYQGGTILGSSRGGFDDEKIIKVLLDNKIN